MRDSSFEIDIAAMIAYTIDNARYTPNAALYTTGTRPYQSNNSPKILRNIES
jgi:hypothetical protein